MRQRARLEAGVKIWWDGQPWTVTGLFAGEIEVQDLRGKRARILMSVVTEAPDFKVLTGADPGEEGASPVYLDSVPPELLRAAEELERQLMEALTGYQHGSRALALEHEPRPQYDPEFTTVRQRTTAKARELGIGFSTLWRYKQKYEERGLAGLVDERKLGPYKDFPRVDDRVKRAIAAVLDELTEESNIPKTQLRRRTRRKLKDFFPDEAVELPSEKTFNKLVDRMAAGRGTFGAAKARRSIANRPSNLYRYFQVVRPGEVVLIDSTPLDAFALDPLTFKWVQVQLTIAMDLYTNSLLAWRFTPVSTKGVDAALLLYDVVRPKFMRNGWPENARWSYVGLPEAIVVELLGDEAQGLDGQELGGLAGVPFLNPEAVWVDRGRVFISRAFRDACVRLGIDLQLARPYTPTDKAQVERLFRTIRDNFVVNLKGYKGPDVYARGKDVESEAFFFIDEIEAEFAGWVATYWQNRTHDGLEIPDLPKMDLSPNRMYEEGLMRAGFTYVLPDPNLYFELLPTEWRKIQHYGIDLRGLRYNSEVLDEWRDAPSPYPNIRDGAWPIRYDPRDLSEVFFHDPTLDEWHAIPRHGASPVNRPFNDATLSYAKSLVIARGGATAADRRRELNQALDDLLDRIAALEVEGRKERRLAAVHAMRTIEAHAERRRAAPQPQVDSVMEPDAEADLDDLFGPDAPLQPAGSPAPEDAAVQGSGAAGELDYEHEEPASEPRKRLAVLDPDDFTV